MKYIYFGYTKDMELTLLYSGTCWGKYFEKLQAAFAEIQKKFIPKIGEEELKMENQG